MKFPQRVILLIFLLILTPGLIHGQGDLTPPEGSPGPEMKSLQEIYDLLTWQQTQLEQQQALLLQQQADINALKQAEGQRPLWSFITDFGEAVDTDLETAPDGQPALAFLTPEQVTGAVPSPGNLRYYKFNGTSWIDQTVDSNTGDDSVLDLEFNPVTGHPAMVYQSATALMLAQWDGSQWNTQLVSDESYSHCSMTFNDSGAPLISASNTNGLSYFYYVTAFQTSFWVAQTVDGSNGAAGTFNEIFYTKDTAIIVYENDAKRYLAVLDGEVWVITDTSDDAVYEAQDAHLLAPGIIASIAYSTEEYAMIGRVYSTQTAGTFGFQFETEVYGDTTKGVALSVSDSGALGVIGSPTAYKAFLYGSAFDGFTGDPIFYEYTGIITDVEISYLPDARPVIAFLADDEVIVGVDGEL